MSFSINVLSPVTLHLKITLLVHMSACHRLYFKRLHLRVTLFSRPLIMHPSSEYLIRREKIKQPVLSPLARRVPLESSHPDLSIIFLKHAEPDIKQHFGAIPGQRCCGSGIKPLKVIIEWFLFFSQPGPERNTSAINQIVSL